MDRTPLQNAIDIRSSSSVTLDSWCQEIAGDTIVDMEKASGVGDESTRMELGSSDEVGSVQDTLAFFGRGIVCDPTREEN